MADTDGMIFLLRYLQENTDCEHPVSSVQLRDILRENGYASDTRTIRKDAHKLRRAGYDILVHERNGVPTTYFYDEHTWEKTELRILIDAVSSAQFITKEKSRQLIDKLAVLSGKQNREDLTPSVFVSEHVKARNNEILYVLETISTAIREKKKISFRYYNYNTDRERIYRHDGEIYVLSPYATVWREDRYYVVGWSDKRNDIVTFRIDRMPTPRLLEETAAPPPEMFNIQDYADKFTRMYGGKEEYVTLRCRAQMIDLVIDKFGLDAEIFDVTDDAFSVRVPAAISGTFLSWVFQFAGKIIILGPENVRDMDADMLRTAQTDMSGNSFDAGSEKEWKL